MADPTDITPRAPSSAPSTPFAADLSSAGPDALLKLTADPRFDEQHVLWLLDRKDLPGALLEKIARRREFSNNYPVMRALVFHPNVPRTAVKPLIRELHLMDIVMLALSPLSTPDLRRIAEDQLIARLPHLPLGQKIALARQAPARILAALISEGNPRVVGPALENPRLTESQVLKLLSNGNLPAPVVPAISRHTRWASLPNVRLALLRHVQTPYEIALRLLRHVTLGELHVLAKLKTISAEFRRQIERAATQR